VVRAAAAGFSFEQIVRTVDGVTTPRAAAQDLRRGLADAMLLRQLDRELLRELELQSLAAVQVAVHGVLNRAAANQGKGDQMVLQASHRLVQLAERRHALEGLLTGPAAPAAEDELSRRRNRVAARRKIG